MKTTVLLYHACFHATSCPFILCQLSTTCAQMIRIGGTSVS